MSCRLVFLVALCALGCRGRDELCTQASDLEVCWGSRPGSTPTRWRERRSPTSAEARPFVCEGDVCRQRWPKLPDDGHWECVDLDGVVVCRGGEPPAGVHPGPASPGWICGGGSPKVCVDLAPEMPEGAMRGWRCTFEHQPDERRMCRRDPEAPRLGGRCDPAGCPKGMSCVEGRCLPARPAPSCWLDKECPQGRCELGSCTPRRSDTTISRSPAMPSPSPRARLGRLVAPPADLPQLGFDAPFALEVQRLHPDAERARIEWRQLAGPSIGLTVEADGFRVRGRTPTLAAAHPGPFEPGLVSFSPRTRGEAVLEATVRCEGHSDEHFTVHVAAVSRSSPVPSIAVSHDVYLGGAGWQLRSSPPGARGALEVLGPVTRLRPDLRGRWIVRDAAGRALSLRVGRYDETPLDCGRSECHPAATAAATTSPMTQVLYRGFEGQLAQQTTPCALACHAVGEPGLDDGGFTSVAHALDFDTSSPRPWSQVPSPLRTLGGVGCTTCHGPGAIPEPSARTAILSAGVCAVCHDAPPRYGHVVAWQASRMARPAREAAEREQPCAACHDTAGFLASIGARPFARLEREEGLGCVTCHAVHDAKSGPHLLRVAIELPAPFAEAAIPAEARVCVRCHASDAARPGPSQAALWLGVGAQTSTGEPLRQPGPHAAVPKGCIGCHAAGPAVERGAGHAFHVDRSRCTGACHQDGDPVERVPGPGRSIAERARVLWQRHGAGAPRPPHALAADARSDRTPAQRTALSNLRLLLDDPAAAFHNAAYARRILDEAERVLR